MLGGESLDGQPLIDFESVEQCLEHSLEIVLVCKPVREDIWCADFPLSFVKERENMALLSKRPHSGMWMNDD